MAKNYEKPKWPFTNRSFPFTDRIFSLTVSSLPYIWFYFAPMKKAFLFLSAFALLTNIGCQMEPETYQQEIGKMEDTLWKSFPTVNRISIEVKQDMGKEVIVTLGDAELYNAPEEQRKQAAAKTAALTKHIFGKKTPEKGKVIFVKEETTISTDESTWKTYDMPESALK